MKDMKPIHVIGGGLAGSEAAWQIAGAGVPVVLHEMRPVRMTDAHKTDGLAELVCSNSFRSDDWENNAVGLLHEEMRRAGSLILAAGDRHKLPAGGALAVDRDDFSADVTRAARSASARHHRARRDRRPAARRLGQRHRRHRPPHLAGAERSRARRHRRRRPRLLRRHRAGHPSRSRSTPRSPGSSRATTRPARPAPAPTISTAR